MPRTSVPADNCLWAVVYRVAAVVRRVVAIVVWFEHMAGLAGTQ